MQSATRTARMWAQLRSPFTAPVPASVRSAVVALQYERLVKALPLLCLLVAANSIAMGLAVMGDLPIWQQLAPPVIIVSTCLIVLVSTRGAGKVRCGDAALRFMRRAPLVAIPLGLVAGAWSVNAFVETEKFYCMVAPVFIGMAALITASCLNAVPRAAIGAMVATTLPIAVKLASYPYLGLRCMAAMLVLLIVMQAWMVLGKFKETVQTLVLQDELNRLAASDRLTGLDNRLAFDAALDELLAGEADGLVALADLDGFKAVNDTYGHLAGDAILVEVAARMRAHAPSARSLARLGGDEFALIFSTANGTLQAEKELAAMRAAVASPYGFDGQVISVGTSLGIALTPEDGRTRDTLLRLADQRLYGDKAARRALRKDGDRVGVPSKDRADAAA